MCECKMNGEGFEPMTSEIAPRTPYQLSYHGDPFNRSTKAIPITKLHQNLLNVQTKPSGLINYTGHAKGRLLSFIAATITGYHCKIKT